jgi:hypothetical protein
MDLKDQARYGRGYTRGIMAAAIKYAQVRSGNYKFFVPLRICPSRSFEVSRHFSVRKQITFLKGGGGGTKFPRENHTAFCYAVYLNTVYANIL